MDGEDENKKFRLQFWFFYRFDNITSYQKDPVYGSVLEKNQEFIKLYRDLQNFYFHPYRFPYFFPSGSHNFPVVYVSTWKSFEN